MDGKEVSGMDSQAEGVATGSSLSKPEFIDDPNAWGVAAFVLGLVGSLLGLMVFTFPVAFVLGVVALVFGLVGLQKPARRAMTVWGTGLGVLCVAISLLGAYVTLQVVDAIGDRVDGLEREFESVLEDAVDDLGDELRSVLNDAIDRMADEVDKGDDLVDKVVSEIDARENG